MKPFNVHELQTQLLNATTRLLGDMPQFFGEGQVYGFVLASNAYGSAISAMAQSEKGFELFVEGIAQVGSWTTKSGNLYELLSKVKRWTFEGWLMFEQYFGEVNRLIDESYSSNPKLYLDEGCGRLVHLCCLFTLAELDVRGAFGKGKGRDAVVLNLYLGDQSEDELIRWATLVNPYQAHSRFAGQLKEANGAFKKLIYVGPV